MKTRLFFLLRAAVIAVLLVPTLTYAQVIATDVQCSPPGCVDTTDIKNNTIKNIDISNAAAIDPAKISGVAWTAANDGAGSTMDADTLDGLDSLQFLRSDANGVMNASLTMAGQLDVYKGTLGFDAINLFRVDPADNHTKVYELSVNGISGGNFNDVQQAYISNSGNAYFAGSVGIGTTSPAGRLETTGSGGIDALVLSYLGSSSFALGPGTGTGDGTKFGIYDRTIGNTRLVIDNSGQVGIGTTVPTAKLHVWNTTGDSELRLTADSDYDSIFRMTGQGGELNEGFYIQYDNNVGDTYFKNIYSADNAFHFLTAAGEPLTIETNGNIGIGTTNPKATLDVHGSVEVNDLMVYPNPAVSDHGNPDLEGSIAWYIKNQLNNGGTIYLQPGTYYVTSQAIPLADNLAIIGSGPGSIIRAYNLTDDLINNESIALGTAGVRNVTLRDFALVGNGYTDWYEGAPDVGDVQDCIDIGGQTDEANYNTNISLSGLTVSSCGRMGIVIKHTNELTMSDIFLHDNGTSTSYHHNIYLSEVNNAMLTNIESERAAGNGLKISHVNRATLTNIIARNNGQYGIRTDANSKEISIAASSAYDNGASGFYFMTDGGGAEDVALSGCTAYGNGNHGVEIAYSDNITVTGCVLRANDQDGMRLIGADNIAMTGNSIRYNASDGLELDASSGNTVFVGNINENNGGVDVNGTVTVKDHNI
ncbi:MAG: right-handed parallel beta-helix repeat-containing protein [Candidatus Kerfeldbacteria bacterium]|nr:right-handed parallel beta-helix repeat-containing protein [Candidatus Kerfeldbacteria bacterium]